jgi:putative transposase
LNENYIDKNISKSRISRNEKGVWQRRFYEHTIRNEESLNNLLDYIHFNPVKHGFVTNVKDWESSSFHKFVKLGNYSVDWGSFDDIKNINSLDLE